MTIGNGTVMARYGYSGKFVHFEYSLQFGSTTSFTGNPKISLPTTPKNVTAVANATATALIGIMDYATRYWSGRAEIRSTELLLNYESITASKVCRESIDASNPMAWATNDSMYIIGQYEEA